MTDICRSSKLALVFALGVYPFALLANGVDTAAVSGIGTPYLQYLGGDVSFYQPDTQLFAVPDVTPAWSSVLVNANDRWALIDSSSAPVLPAKVMGPPGAVQAMAVGREYYAPAIYSLTSEPKVHRYPLSGAPQLDANVGFPPSYYSRKRLFLTNTVTLQDRLIAAIGSHLEFFDPETLANDGELDLAAEPLGFVRFEPNSGYAVLANHSVVKVEHNFLQPYSSVPFWTAPDTQTWSAFALTDVNGDGYQDLIVAGDANKLIAYDVIHQQTLWTRNRTYPANQLLVVDVTGDATPELLISDAAGVHATALSSDTELWAISDTFVRGASMIVGNVMPDRSKGLALRSSKGLWFYSLSDRTLQARRVVSVGQLTSTVGRVDGEPAFGFLSTGNSSGSSDMRFFGLQPLRPLVNHSVQTSALPEPYQLESLAFGDVDGDGNEEAIAGGDYAQLRLYISDLLTGAEERLIDSTPCNVVGAIALGNTLPTGGREIVTANQLLCTPATARGVVAFDGSNGQSSWSVPVTAIDLKASDLDRNGVTDLVALTPDTIGSDLVRIDGITHLTLETPFPSRYMAFDVIPQTGAGPTLIAAARLDAIDIIDQETMRPVSSIPVVNWKPSTIAALRDPVSGHLLLALDYQFNAILYDTVTDATLWSTPVSNIRSIKAQRNASSGDLWLIVTESGAVRVFGHKGDVLFRGGFEGE